MDVRESLGEDGTVLFFFKQKTAYEMRISDWSSDVCSSDLIPLREAVLDLQHQIGDHLAVELDDERLGEAVWIHEGEPVLVEARRPTGEPPCDLVELTEPPRRLRV